MPRANVSCSVGGRKNEIECCNPFGRGAPDFSIMCFDDGAGNGQTKPSIARSPLSPCRVGPVEAIKNLVDVLWVNGCPAVFDREGYLVCGLLNFYRDPASVRRVSNGIRENIDTARSIMSLSPEMTPFLEA